MPKVVFQAGTLSQYQALSSYDENTLYFIEDAGLIYKGSNDITSSVEMLTSFDNAVNHYEGKLYIAPVTPSGEGATTGFSGYELRIITVNDGTKTWTTINPGYYTDGANWAAADSGRFATIGLIKSAITSAISSLETQLQNKVDKVSNAVENNLVIFGTAGAIADSNVSIGGSTLEETPTANKVATEAAVAEALSWEQLV